MIESYLINAGLGCGTKKNFQTEILKNVKLGVSDRWYFRTPVKVSSHGLKTATLDMAFPFLAKLDDVNESAVLSRLEINRKAYEDDLLRFLRSKGFIVPPDSAIFTIIPFYAGGNEPRDDRKDFGGIRVHILNAVVTVKYRCLPLSTSTDLVLYHLKNEQIELERKIDTLTIYVGGADFAALEQSDQDLLTVQLAAMNTYNDCLEAQIINY